MAKKITTKKATRTTTAKRNSSPKVTRIPLKEVVTMEVEKNETAAGSTPPIARTLKKPQVAVPIIVLIILALLVYIFRSWFFVATVNGQLITRMELDHQLEQQDGKQVMDSLVTQKLVAQEADAKHITVSQQDVDAAIKQISDSISKQGQTLDSVLLSRGMTRKDLQDQVKLQKIVEKLVGNTISVSDKEIQDYIDNNKDSLPTGLSDDQLKAQVKQQLQQQKLSDKAQALIQDLQKKAKINYIVSF